MAAATLVRWPKIDFVSLCLVFSLFLQDSALDFTEITENIYVSPKPAKWNMPEYEPGSRCRCFVNAKVCSWYFLV